MKQNTCFKKSFKVIGLTARSNNKFEVEHESSKIFPVVRDFVHKKVTDSIPSRVKPGTLICGYKDYESDHTGDYTYFIGEIVDDSIVSAPEGLSLIEIPEQNYVKFTNGPAAMPAVVKEPWSKIWEMSGSELGGKRSYKVDWEVYDERAKDHSAIVLDIYVGID